MSRLLSISITRLGLKALVSVTIYLKKDGSNVTNLDDKHSKGTHWVSLFIIYWKISSHAHSFEFEYNPQKVLNKMKDKSITHKIFRILGADSIMRVFYCIAFIEYLLEGKTLLDYTNLFSPNDYNKGQDDPSLKFKLKKQM